MDIGIDLIRLDSDTAVLISAMIIKKSWGPNTVSSGAPLNTGESALISSGSQISQNGIDL